MPGSTGKIGGGLNIFDAQASHGSEVAKQHYGLEIEDPHRYGDTFFEDFAMISNWWWLLIWHENLDLLTADEIARGRDAPAQLGLAAPASTGQSISVTDIAQLRDMLLADGEFARQLGQRIASELTASNIGLQPMGGTDDHRGVGLRLPKAPGEESMKAAKVLVEAHHNTILQTYCGDRNAAWTCEEQGQALVHVLQRKTSLLIILPTGAGKSVLFGAPRYFEQGVTVVVSPLRALMVNQIEESKRRDPRAPFIQWERDLNMVQGVVITPAENLSKRSFRNWCATQQARGCLARIVIDEAHLVPSSKDYRYIMRCLKPLVESRVPIVCLTATLPPSMEDELRAGIGDPRWQIIRTGTQRRNLHLRVARYACEEHAKRALKRVLNRYTSELAAYQAIMIIVPRRQVADELASELNVDAYHSGKTVEDKDEAAARWLSGERQIIVGTTAIGTGVHHPHCSLVIHWGHPHGLLSYAQETGRAGRAGGPALCILFHWGGHPTLKGSDNKGFGPLLDMLDDSKCLRVHLSRYLDGDDMQVSCFSNMALCSRCLVLRDRADSRVGRHPSDPLPNPDGGCLPDGVLPHSLIWLGAGQSAPTPHVSAPQSLQERAVSTWGHELSPRSHARGDPQESYPGDKSSPIDEQMADRSDSSSLGVNDVDPMANIWTDDDEGNDVDPDADRSTDGKVDHELNDEMEIDWPGVEPASYPGSGVRHTQPGNSDHLPGSAHSDAVGRGQEWTTVTHARRSKWAYQGAQLPSRVLASGVDGNTREPRGGHADDRRGNSSQLGDLPSRTISTSQTPLVATHAERPVQAGPSQRTFVSAGGQPLAGTSRPNTFNQARPASSPRESSIVDGRSYSEVTSPERDAITATRRSYPRYRPPPESPTHRRRPSTNQEITPSQARFNAMNSLVAMAPTGTPIINDADDAVARHATGTDLNEHHEAGFGEFSFKNLLTLKQEAHRWSQASGSLDPKRCSVNDFLLPLVWVIIADRMARAELFDYFRLGPPSSINYQDFFRWLFSEQEARDVTWANTHTLLFNIHRVFLWAALLRKPGKLVISGADLHRSSAL
ncbi:hypothetical protein FRC06_002858 [Ceratobasidium sp. 370]|nr:hypothetical protein FRC06_002858 [Ceratobasidium sp. 370]